MTRHVGSLFDVSQLQQLTDALACWRAGVTHTRALATRSSQRRTCLAALQHVASALAQLFGREPAAAHEPEAEAHKPPGVLSVFGARKGRLAMDRGDLGD